MTLEINVPGGSPALPGFSVAKNEHGLSIAAGTLNSARVIFGLANDEGGVSVNAFPTGEARNLCPNPRAHVNWLGWSSEWTSASVSRATTARLPLPAGADACFRFTTTERGVMYAQTELLPVPAGWTRIYSSAYACVDVNEYSGFYWQCDIQGSTFYAADEGELYPVGEGSSGSSATHDDTEWAYKLKWDDVPPGAVYFRTLIFVDALVGGSAWFTKVMVSDADRPYADGDSAGWSWDGVAHASSSRGPA